ncbi:hypothetical protein GCM10009759_77310 [Kitasatospora saccharophila]|uniref:Uncharacterized protein n=1 Tax=Kitasatospora saccharophila TaxID=407973 RepID=A0ABP5K028_9ACTN
MRYATIARELLPLLARALAVPEPRPARAADVDQRRTPTEDRLVAAASPLRSGPRYRPRRPAALAAA